MARKGERRISAVSHATTLVRKVCTFANDTTLIDDSRVGLARAGVIEAVRNHDDMVLFDWMLEVLSYQGVSDAVASGYIEYHGSVRAGDVARGLQRRHLCPKLTSYWHFEDCGYLKSTRSCSQPKSFRQCPLPRHDLRNGRLNQSAYSLFLFMRDIAGGDFVGWLDRRLAHADTGTVPDRAEALAASVVEPMTHIYGVSDKVLSMSLSSLLIAGDPERERWQTAGAAMIVVDTLVHNWLHRTGILSRFGSDHLYGPKCYSEGGCATIIRRVAQRIDASAYNPDFPRTFPRFVQKALWQFCAQDHIAQCNGNRIDDRDRCGLSDCLLFSRCDRVTLQRPKPDTVAGCENILAI